MKRFVCVTVTLDPAWYSASSAALRVFLVQGMPLFLRRCAARGYAPAVVEWTVEDKGAVPHGHAVFVRPRRYTRVELEMMSGLWVFGRINVRMLRIGKPLPAEFAWLEKGGAL